MPDRKLRIGLFWHSHNSANLGVGALTVSNMMIARQVAEECGCAAEFVIVGAREPGESYISASDAEIRTVDRHFVTSPSGLWKTMSDLDIVLDITGGDSFTDIYGFKRFAFQQATKSAAILRGVPLIFSPQTIGPFQEGWSSFLARRVMTRAQGVIARDESSYHRAKALAPKARLSQSIDVAFVLPYEKAALPDNGCLKLGFNVSGLLWSERPENARFGLGYAYRPLVRKLLAHFTAQENVEVHLIPHVHAPHLDYENDCVAHAALAEEFPSAIVVPAFPSPSAAKSYIAAMDFFMGSRMHACIAAYSSGVPLLPISYSPKFDGLFETLGYDWLVPVHGADTDAAFAIALQAFEERDAMRDSIAKGREKVSALQENYRALLRQAFRSIINQRESA